MKRTVMIMAAVFIFSLSYASDAPVPVTPAAEAAAEAVTKAAKEDKSVFDAVMGIFAPSEKKEEGVTQTASTMEAEYEEEAEEGIFTLPGKLLIAGNLFSTGIAALSWINLSQGTQFYEQMYADINNTTLENYDKLKMMRQAVLNAETQAWVTTGIAAVLISYTIVDVFWLHAAFPLEPEFKSDSETQILTLNYRF